MRYFKHNKSTPKFDSFIVTDDNMTKYKYGFPKTTHHKEIQFKPITKMDIKTLNKLYVEIPEEEVFIMMI